MRVVVFVIKSIVVVFYELEDYVIMVEKKILKKIIINKWYVKILFKREDYVD